MSIFIYFAIFVVVGTVTIIAIALSDTPTHSEPGFIFNSSGVVASRDKVKDAGSRYQFASPMHNIRNDEMMITDNSIPMLKMTDINTGMPAVTLNNSTVMSFGEM